jgi:hypothetical protein
MAQTDPKPAPATQKRNPVVQTLVGADPKIPASQNSDLAEPKQTGADNKLKRFVEKRGFRGLMADER